MHTFLRFLKRNKLYTAINLLGLSLSMAFVLLLADYVSRQLTVDSFQKNADRITLVASDEALCMPYYMSRNLKERYPEIERAASVFPMETIETEIAGELVNATASCVDTSFFDIFSFEVTAGSAELFKANGDGVMVSESFARNHFRSDDAVGKTLNLHMPGMDKLGLTVTGVYKDMEGSVIKPSELLIRGEFAEKINSSNDASMSNASSSYCFVLTYPGADISLKKSDMVSWLKDIFWVYTNGMWKDVKLFPLRDLYFNADDCVDSMGGLNRGNWQFVMLLLAMCLVLLLFAILNYVNMTTALTGFRAKEMATRRLVGAGKGSLFKSAIAESTVVCTVAMLIALLLGEAIAPSASTLLSYHISLLGSISPLSILCVLLLTLFIGFLAGLVPAMIIQGVQPMEIVRGTLRYKTKTLYSKLIIIAQNVVTIAILVSAMTMFLQVNSLIKAPLGYNVSDYIVMPNSFGLKGQVSSMIDRLRAESCVDAVGLGNGHPMLGTNNWTMNMEDGHPVGFQMVQGDSTYFNILGFKKKQDNHIDGWWLNEYAFNAIGIDENAESFRSESATYAIGGIYNDFRLNTILVAQKPTLIKEKDEWEDEDYPWTFVIKTSGSHKDAMDRVTSIVSASFPGKIVEAKYIDDCQKELFAEDRRLMTIVVVFAILALLVSALGLVAMSSYYMQQEARSVALRKVFGGDYSRLLIGLVMTFLKMVCIAFVISVPLSWTMMDRWLQGYSYHIGLSWWIFAVSCVVALIIAGLSVLWQSVKTARTNPAVTLKKE